MKTGKHAQTSKNVETNQAFYHPKLDELINH